MSNRKWTFHFGLYLQAVVIQLVILDFDDENNTGKYSIEK